MRQREVILAPDARDDLANLYDWIAEATSPAVAISYVERLESGAATLTWRLSEASGGTTSEPGCASSVWNGGSRSPFEVEKDRVIIPCFFYGGRDWPRDEF